MIENLYKVYFKQIKNKIKVYSYYNNLVKARNRK